MRAFWNKKKPKLNGCCAQPKLNGEVGAKIRSKHCRPQNPTHHTTCPPPNPSKTHPTLAERHKVQVVNLNCSNYRATDLHTSLQVLT